MGYLKTVVMSRGHSLLSCISSKPFYAHYNQCNNFWSLSTSQIPIGICNQKPFVLVEDRW